MSQWILPFLMTWRLLGQSVFKSPGEPIDIEPKFLITGWTRRKQLAVAIPRVSCSLSKEVLLSYECLLFCTSGLLVLLACSVSTVVWWRETHCYRNDRKSLMRNKQKKKKGKPSKIILGSFKHFLKYEWTIELKLFQYLHYSFTYFSSFWFYCLMLT